MKKIWIGLMVFALVGFWAQAGFAAVEDSDTVTVTVDEIETLEVPESTALKLNTVSTVNPTQYAQGTKTDTGGLKYTHNSGTTKKITATAAAGGGNAANDITLKVAIGTEPAGTIVDAGVDVTAGVVLWTNIAADSYTKDLNWTADGSVATTKAGAYIWTVTFTSADAT